MMPRIGLTRCNRPPLYTGAGSLPCALHLRFATSDASLRNQLSTRMECLIHGLGFWNGGSCHLIVKRLFANFAKQEGQQVRVHGQQAL
jgi:hypothetical protein